MNRILTFFLVMLLPVFFGCQQQLGRGARTPRYVYHAGYTPKILRSGKVTIPSRAPARIKRAIAAGNKIVGKPYRLGGGHRKHYDSAYDCSGSVAFVLREAGMLKRGTSPSSRDFFRWGHPGFGKWLTVYTKRGHVFLMIAGMRFDTTGSGRGVGPRWYTSSRPCSGFVVRHLPGF
ncbi:MAG: peptidoglycan endopeptidase [Akkermansia sp.]|nr:peptidoglycan endopeptidase [Akkermansia sp.]